MIKSIGTDFMLPTTASPSSTSLSTQASYSDDPPGGIAVFGLQARISDRFEATGRASSRPGLHVNGKVFRESIGVVSTISVADACVLL